MAYTDNQKSTGLDLLTDLTITQSDLHIVGDVSDSGRAKAITQNLLEDYIANSTNFINELTTNSTFITNIGTIAPSPLTTKGDIFTHNTTVPDRLPVGTNGQFLSANSSETTGLKWVTLASNGTGTKVDINTAESTLTGSTTETTLFTIVIPAGTLLTDNAIRYSLSGNTALGGLGNATFRVKYGGTTIATLVAGSADSGDYNLTGVIIADGATNAQKGTSQLFINSNTDELVDKDVSAVDSTVDQNLVITAQLGNSGSTLTAEDVIVEKITDGSTQFNIGVTTRDSADASSVQTIAHGVNGIPTIVRLDACIAFVSTTDRIANSKGIYKSDTNSTASIYFSSTPGSNDLSGNSTTYAIAIYKSDGSGDGQVAVATVDATNITLTWTKIGGGFNGGTIQVLWEASI